MYGLKRSIENIEVMRQDSSHLGGADAHAERNLCAVSPHPRGLQQLVSLQTSQKIGTWAKKVRWANWMPTRGGMKTGDQRIGLIGRNVIDLTTRVDEHQQ